MAKVGNEYYLQAENDCFVFNSMGELVSADGGTAIDKYNSRVVNFLSAITDGNNYYEVYFNGKKKYFSGVMVQDIYMNFVTKAGRGGVPVYLDQMFHYKSEGSAGIISCILLAYGVGEMSQGIIDNVLTGKGMSEWVDL